jgi:hypothetical protein
MRKLRLDLQGLVVETFHPHPGMTGAGTVHGARFELAHDSGGSDCPNCWSADPCTNIPIETCTCGCGPDPVTTPHPTKPEPIPHTGCAATSVCTCTPVETCSCNYAFG